MGLGSFAALSDPVLVNSALPKPILAQVGMAQPIWLTKSQLLLGVWYMCGSSFNQRTW
jgi:hypothetical protein